MKWKMRMLQYANELTQCIFGKGKTISTHFMKNLIEKKKSSVS